MDFKNKVGFLFIFVTQLILLLILISTNIYSGAIIVFIWVACLITIYINLNNTLKGVTNIDKTVTKYYEKEEELDSLKDEIIFNSEKNDGINKKIKLKKDELSHLQKEIDLEKEQLEISVKKTSECKEQIIDFENKLSLQKSIVSEIEVNNNELKNSQEKLELIKNELEITRKEIDTYRDLITRTKGTIIQEELAIIDTMDGIEFEEYLSIILTSNGYQSSVTKASGDQGADLIIEKNNIKYAVQAKRYSNTVGNTAVQEVVSSKLFYGLDNAIVITNNYFTHSARELAKRCDVELIDRMGLSHLIDQAINNNPSLYAEKSKASTIIEINR